MDVPGLDAKHDWDTYKAEDKQASHQFRLSLPEKRGACKFSRFEDVVDHLRND
jgi:hypothetical protein